MRLVVVFPYAEIRAGHIVFVPFSGWVGMRP